MSNDVLRYGKHGLFFILCKVSLQTEIIIERLTVNNIKLQMEYSVTRKQKFSPYSLLSNCYTVLQQTGKCYFKVST
jgi:hypothetical protein